MERHRTSFVECQGKLESEKNARTVRSVGQSQRRRGRAGECGGPQSGLKLLTVIGCALIEAGSTVPQNLSFGATA